MTTISAKSILASRHAVTGKRLDTLLLRYPRWIHAECRTHRVMNIEEDVDVEIRTPSLMQDPYLSRNASSSRAIPVSKLIQDIIDDPAIPIHWGKNQKGMQGGDDCDELVLIPEYHKRESGDHIVWAKITRERAWLEARDSAIRIANAFSYAGYHKQIVNRLLEPFSHITVVVSATEWDNFFELRDHADAEPHIHDLAIEMRKAMAEAEVQTLQPGEWHLPFILQEDRSWDDGCLKDIAAIKLSVSRCASTSYKTVEGFDMTLDRAIALHDKLVASKPIHASPCEHVAMADDVHEVEFIECYGHPADHKNFRGFRQYRAFVERGEQVV